MQVIFPRVPSMALLLAAKGRTPATVYTLAGLLSSYLHPAGTRSTPECARPCAAAQYSSSPPMAAPEQPSAGPGIGLGTPSSPLLLYDDDAHNKMTPAAVVDRLNRFIVGQVSIHMPSPGVGGTLPLEEAGREGWLSSGSIHYPMHAKESVRVNHAC
jgi:hypothetical protein